MAGFLLWALCFVLHPFVAEHAQNWGPMLNQVWDLEKFVVMFGLLMVTLEEHSARSEYQSLHDELTGLANRRLVNDRLQQALARAQRDHSRLVVFNMDLNRFKQVNDSYGHGAGDELLRVVAERLSSITRACDTLARVGGDEFLLVSSDFNISEANRRLDPDVALRQQGEAWANALRAAVEKPAALSNGDICITPSISIGFAIYPNSAEDLESLFALADNDMYSNKRRYSAAERTRSAGSALAGAAVADAMVL
ncbi:GGDEF domain-containing protein [Granulicella cerasi]|uniref:GGDEF domain-containing protein n=1 Tax=Granulicella cerasi TaxID=741063 RepID=A0ABW1ZFY0_9BACT